MSELCNKIFDMYLHKFPVLSYKFCELIKVKAVTLNLSHNLSPLFLLTYRLQAAAKKTAIVKIV